MATPIINRLLLLGNKIKSLLNYFGNTKVIIATSGGTTYASGSTKLYMSTDLNLTWGDSLIDITPDYFSSAYISSTGTVIALTNAGNMYRSTDGTTFAQVDTTALGVILTPLWGCFANNGDTIVFAEYSTEAGDKRVFTSTDDGATWAVTLTKVDPDDIRHWHSCQWIASIGQFLLTSGDSNLQVKWFTSPTGAVNTWYEIPGISSVDATSQMYRNLSVVENGTNLMWGSDTQVGAAIYKMPTRNIVSLVNLLGAYGALLEDADANGIADGLSPINVTGSIADGTQTITTTETVSEHYTQFSVLAFSDTPVVGDKLYYAGVFRAPNSRARVTLFSKKADGAYASSAATSASGLEDFTFISVELDIVSLHETPVIYLRQAVLQLVPGETLYAGSGEYIQFKNLAYINKTKCFGAGNEPTKAELDAVMATKTHFITSQYESLSPVKVYDLPHACWGLAKGATEYVAVTSVETGDADRSATVHTSKDGVKWQLDKKWAIRSAYTYGGFRSARYLSTHKRYAFNIQYLENTTTAGNYSIVASLK